jgi:type VI secretion system protein ImpJ
MLMSPQHLQSLDRFHEGLVAARVGALTPYDWGVAALEVDPAALGTGQVRLQRFAGVMPDGAAVAFDESDADAPAPRAAGEHFPAAARSLDVHLCLAREREGVSSVAADGNARSRYLLASRAVQDTSAEAGASAAVAFGRPNLVLLFGDEAREDYESIKIAELIRGATGQLELAPSYLPPLLRIGASPWLIGAIRQVSARVIGKQRELTEARGQRDPSTPAAAELSRFLQLFALNASLPLVAHLAESADASAREAYLILARLAGELATFAHGADPATLPKFAYTDLRSTFEPLFARLTTVLGGLAVAQYVTVPLEQRPGGLHLARLQDDRILRSQLFLAVKSDLSEPQVAEQLPRLCKIASTAEIQGLVQAAAPGLPLRVEHRPPPQIPMRPGTLYFSLATDNRYWQGILANRNLVLYLPPPFDPARTSVELLAVAPQGPQATAPFALVR